MPVPKVLFWGSLRSPGIVSQHQYQLKAGSDLVQLLGGGGGKSGLGKGCTKSIHAPPSLTPPATSEAAPELVGRAGARTAAGVGWGKGKGP